MALCYEYRGTEDTKQWTKEDWQNWNNLIWATICVDIGDLSDSNIEEFCRRGNLLHLWKEELQPDQIKKFIGLHTNVLTLTSKKWAIKHFARKDGR